MTWLASQRKRISNRTVCRAFAWLSVAALIVLWCASYVECLFIGFREDHYREQPSPSSAWITATYRSSAIGIFAFEGTLALGSLDQERESTLLRPTNTPVPTQV